MESLSSSANDLEMDEDFRLWLSTKPDNRIPVPILQSSHKVAIEEPAGLKAQLLKVQSHSVVQSRSNDVSSNEFLFMKGILSVRCEVNCLYIKCFLKAKFTVSWSS